MEDNKRCKCTHCQTLPLYKWATIMECKCSCHESGFVSHDGLCCELPNVLKKNNPYEHLESAKHYDDIIHKWMDM